MVVYMYIVSTKVLEECDLSMALEKYCRFSFVVLVTITVVHIVSTNLFEECDLREALVSYYSTRGSLGNYTVPRLIGVTSGNFNYNGAKLWYALPSWIKSISDKSQ